MIRLRPILRPIHCMQVILGGLSLHLIVQYWCILNSMVKFKSKSNFALLSSVEVEFGRLVKVKIYIRVQGSIGGAMSNHKRIE